MNFYLPDFSNKFTLNLRICQIFREHPEYFHTGFNIGAIYGSFPGMIWNGGRCLPGHIDQETIKHILTEFEKLEIPIRFTMTNCFIQQEHLDDKYCNMILQMAYNSSNGIIINSPILEDYLRYKYPNFQYISSTTKCERDINKINLACEQYDMVVTDYRDNKDMTFLNTIQYKNKIELLLNAYCSPDCPVRSLHYALLSKDQLHQTIDGKVIPGCNGTDDFYDSLKFFSVIKNNELKNYIDMGFQNFKIEGRLVHLIDVIESYIYYLIKPEYQNIVRVDLLKTCVTWNE